MFLEIRSQADRSYQKLQTHFASFVLDWACEMSLMRRSCASALQVTWRGPYVVLPGSRNASRWPCSWAASSRTAVRDPVYRILPFRLSASWLFSSRIRSHGWGNSIPKKGTCFAFRKVSSSGPRRTRIFATNLSFSLCLCVSRFSYSRFVLFA